MQTDSIKIPQVKGKIAQSILNERVISGTVTAASDGLPLPGVTVLVKGTTRGTSTDIDGKYTLKVKLGDVLVFHFVSMKSTEKTIGTLPIIDVAMEDDSYFLDEAVFFGVVETSYFNYPKYREETYETIEEKKHDYEKRVEKRNIWKAKNIKNRLKWKAERIAKKLARQEARKNKKAN